MDREPTILAGVLNGEHAWEVPMPGDFVQAFQCCSSVIPDGTYGVIEGVRGKAEPAYSICWNIASHPWGGGPQDSVIDASGGPVHLDVPIALLQPTRQTMQRVFYSGRAIPHATPTVIRTVRLYRLDFQGAFNPREIPVSR